MKKLLLIGVFFFSISLFSQNQGGIKGSVIDRATNNEPLLFANIQLKGSDIGNQTNFHGNFEIQNLVPGDYSIVISYAGYKTEEVAVTVETDKITQFEIGLSPMQINFEDVAGMDIVSRKNIDFSTDTEKTP